MPETRLPLQIGVSALYRMTRAAFALVPVVTFAALVVVLLLPSSANSLAEPNVVEGLKWLWMFVVVLVPFAGLELAYAIREWPHDIVLSRAGLRWRCRQRARFVEWPQIDIDHSVLEKVERRGFSLQRAFLLAPVFVANVLFYVFFGLPVVVIDLGLRLIGSKRRIMAWFDEHIERALRPTPVEAWRLRLVLVDGEEIVIAETGRLYEQRSLAAILHTVRHLTGVEGMEATAPVDERSLEIMVCRQCGAPAIPDLDPVVLCHSCGAEVAVSDSIRERIRAHAELAADGGQTANNLTTLLHQSGARRARWLVSAAALLTLAAAPAASVLAVALYRRGLFDWLLLVSLAASAVLFIVGVVAATRAALVDRLAYRLVALEFAAIPPRRSEEPFCCRWCHAPLSRAERLQVVRCPYCGTDNITGLDVRPQASSLSRQRRYLAAALSARRRQRAWALACALLALPCLGWASRTVRTALTYIETPHLYLVERCDRGNGWACARAALRYEFGVMGAPQDDDKAAALNERARQLGAGFD